MSYTSYLMTILQRVQDSSMKWVVTAILSLGLDMGTVRATLLEIRSGDVSSFCPKDGGWSMG
jgi:hypothetical protein